MPEPAAVMRPFPSRRETRKIPPPRRGYSAEARKLWREIVGGWDLDAPALQLLDSACRARMRVRQAQALLAKEGIVMRDRFDQAKPHPAVVVERDAEATFLRSLKALNLDLEPLRPGPGRPPGGRAA